MDDQIFKVKRPPVEKPIDHVRLHRFILAMEGDKRKDLEKPPLSDYDRTTLKFQK